YSLIEFIPQTKVMARKGFFLFVLFLSSVQFLKAQIDSAYIEQFPNKITISPYFSSTVNRITIVPQTETNDSLVKEVEYQTNARGGFGIGLSYRVFDFSLGVRQKLSPESEAIYGKTIYTNLSF